MGDTLFGKEVSGTPMETRGATRSIGRRIERGFQFGRDPLGDVRSAASRETLGFDPALIGAPSAARAALADPADQMEGLFTSLRPFEERTVSRNVSDLRNMFGTVGGRFSRRLPQAESNLRGRLAEGFARTREQSLLEAAARRNQALQSILGLNIRAGEGAINPLLSFASPGRPNFQEGIAGDILAAGGRAAAGYFGG